MKAEELMIGDWVYGCTDPYETYRDKKKYPVKVIRIDADGDTMTEVENPFTEPYEDEWWNLEPIPLTPKILEKNGFSNYADSWYFPSDEKNIRIGFHMYETVLDIKTDNASFYKKIPYGYRSIIKYGSILSVHELQHALKLCGIKKEIML